MATQTVFARANPETIRITETYEYTQEISRNPFHEARKEPSGTIDIVVPYDGRQYFTRTARQDVEKQIKVHQQQTEPNSGDVEALIGHLLLTEYDKTDLDDKLSLSDHYGSIPVKVPAINDTITTMDHLCSDQHACHIHHEYSPSVPEVNPILVEMELLDEDILTVPSVELLTKEGAEDIEKVEAHITRQISFPRSLLLQTTARVHLPAKMAHCGALPRICKVSLGWPTLTSLCAFSLSVGNQNAIPVTYNPMTRSLEWEDVPMSLCNSSEGIEDTRTFISKPMTLLIDQPGELYQQDSLTGTIEVEIPGRLLSGVDIRYFDGAGEMRSDFDTALATRVVASIVLIPDDAFFRRRRSHYQHFHLDEVIPDEMRIVDIITALKDRDFQIHTPPPKSQPKPAKYIKHFIHASRPEGPDSLDLLIFVEGQRYDTQRQTRVPGGQTYTSTVESGDLKIYIRGEFIGDSGIIVREINALQLILRNRFEGLRTKR